MDKQTITGKKHMLFDLTPLDSDTEDIDERTKRCYTKLKQLIDGKSQKECQEIYSKYIASNPQVHIEDLTMGLLVAILHEPDGQSDYFRDIVALSKDNLNLFSTYLNTIIIERITRLSNTSIKHVFWLANQLIKASTNSAETTCSNLVRQTAKSDLSPRNLWMADQLIDMLCDNRDWIINTSQFMGPTVVYNEMRLIIDHMGPSFRVLRKKETDFVIGLIKERFDYITLIGKDFLRLLNHMTRLPEFQALHQDIYLNNPKLLNPKYEGPHQLLANRTPRRLFQSCLTFDMEKKIAFLATQVKLGNQKRYQDWFAKQYFANGDVYMLRSDIIRYICTIIHPSNEVLCSDIIPRWANIGWLILSANHVISNCRFALFYDWFTFDPRSDNIMNIEPGILIMCHSARLHTHVTANLLHFLCQAPSTFVPKVGEIVRAGIKRSFQTILEKRVLQSLAPVFINPKFDPILRTTLKESFPEYCHTESNGVSNVQSPITAPQLPTQPNVPISPTTQNAPTNPTAVVQTFSTVTVPLASTAAQSMKKKPDAPLAVNDNTRSTPEVILIDDVANHKSDASNQASKTNPNESTSAATNHHQGTNNSHGIGFASETTNPKQTRQHVMKQASSWTGGDSDSTDKSLIGSANSSNHDTLNEAKNKSRTPQVIKQESTIMRSTIDQIVIKPSGKYSTTSDRSKSSTTTDGLDDDDVDVLTTEHPSWGNNSNSTLSIEEPTPTKVIYPFMIVKEALNEEDYSEFDEQVGDVLRAFEGENDLKTRRKLMSKLISVILQVDDQSPTIKHLDQLAVCIAQVVSQDFTVRIMPPNRLVESLEQSISKPFFLLCRSGFDQKQTRILNLLVAMSKVYGATGFLILYFMRARFVIQGSQYISVANYTSFCQLSKRDLTDNLMNDLKMMCEYDAEMFCFMLPIIFTEYAAHGGYQITNNIDLIHLVVSAVDPVSLHEILCLCITNTMKMIKKDEPLSLIEASLKWESWEQYCFWKIVTAQGVPVENYISILRKLDSKSCPEALSSIMLNLQKIIEPSVELLEQVIDSYSDDNVEVATSSVRYWSFKNDPKELARNIASLFNLRAASPPGKRKGQPKAKSWLTPRTERVLKVLDHIRLKAPRNKLFMQSELLEAISQAEESCSSSHKQQYADLFAFRPKHVKKKVKLDT